MEFLNVYSMDVKPLPVIPPVIPTLLVNKIYYLNVLFSIKMFQCSKSIQFKFCIASFINFCL